MTWEYIKEWLKATGIRMLRTFAEGFLSVAGVELVKVTQVDWIGALEVGATAAIISFGLALTGLPEVEPKYEIKE